ncbi:MAG: polyprenyl synthetase family protein [Mariprofundales bacterium]|nr:polyprenyl synthetase family protein [Mariprofundales bacterium]
MHRQPLAKPHSADPPQVLITTAQTINHELLLMMNRYQRVVPQRLWSAMRYSLLAGGKRVRPTLLLACFDLCGGADRQQAMPAALAIDCLHTYSLIHDDLPAMDNDDLRRGQPTCHRKFDEATAILAADALHALSFSLLADVVADDTTKIELCKKMATAAGCQGMVGGQMLDMESESISTDDLLQVERIHIHKTGALIRFSCEAGAMLADADDEQQHHCIRFGEAIGLLFQIVDDLLDTTVSSRVLGKSAGKDAHQNKATYISVLGVDGTRQRAQEVAEMALQACDALDDTSHKRAGTMPLRQLTSYILNRGY